MSLCYAPYGHLFKSHVNVIQTRNNVFILFFTVTGCFFHSCARGACVLNPIIRQEYNNKKLEEAAMRHKDIPCSSSH